VERLLTDPRHRAAVEREVRAVAEEIAADAGHLEEEGLGPDEQARERFRTFARTHVSAK